MTFATMEEAWGTMEPYENYVNDYKNVARESNNNANNIPEEQPKNNNYSETIPYEVNRTMKQNSPIINRMNRN